MDARHWARMPRERMLLSTFAVDPSPWTFGRRAPPWQNGRGPHPGARVQRMMRSRQQVGSTAVGPVCQHAANMFIYLSLIHI
eukprot:4313027-Lingulodinium_polyedra.AAC.1